MHQGQLPDDTWSVVEEGLNLKKLRFWETLFTLGNGYLGLRGVLEEGCEGEYAGTYLAGVYDQSEGQSFEIVNAPNPLTLEIHCNGTKLGIDEMEVIGHRRILDLKRSILTRRTTFKDQEGRRYEYESTRFFSLDDLHLGWMRVDLRPVDSDAEVVVKDTIDGTTRNELQAIGAPVKHYSVIDAGANEDLLYLLAKTNDLGIEMGFGTALDVRAGGKVVENTKARYRANEETSVRELTFKIRKGMKCRIDKLISVFTSRDLEAKRLNGKCIEILKSARERGLNDLLRRHVAAWDRAWRNSDVEITGDEGVQKALRFDIYHLLITAPPRDLDVSIPAKTLSGEWYKGHVFWDVEIYLLPFFIYTQPKEARDLLLYRYRRLDQARAGAKVQGYLGSLWPWESALSGDDETPDECVDFDGTKIPVYNKVREHHIASDVIYGVFRYYSATGDEDFLVRHGAEMVFETARFWASRVTYNKKSGRYEIREVIGPNEFQRCVDNNSYTNGLARWTLVYASELYFRLLKERPRKLRALVRKIGLDEKEVGAWKEIAEKIVFLTSPNGLIEEFEDYFNRRDVSIDEWNEKSMPIWPSEVELAEVEETQLVKQADVVLLLYLLSDEFSADVRKINFEYYEPRTVHKSSLSIPSHAIIALELGDIEKAYKYFTLAVNTDLRDLYGNTEYGMHAAALGGSWQILVHGFAGVKVKGDVLCADPTRPKHWRNLRFRIWFRGALIEFFVTESETKASMIEGKKGVNVEIYGRRSILSPGKSINVRKE